MVCLPLEDELGDGSQDSVYSAGGEELSGVFKGFSSRGFSETLYSESLRLLVPSAVRAERRDGVLVLDFESELAELLELREKKRPLSRLESREDLEARREGPDARDVRPRCSPSTFSCCFLALLSPTFSTFGSVQITSNILVVVFGRQL